MPGRDDQHLFFMQIKFTKGVWMMLVASFAFGLMNVSVKMIQGLPVAEIVLFRAFIQILIGYAFIVNMGISPLGKNKLLLQLKFTGAAANIIRLHRKRQAEQSSAG